MARTIDDIYRTRMVHDADGVAHPLDSAIGPAESLFLAQFISRRPTIVRTLEVGCAQGLSSLVICDAIRDREGRSHRILDPDQAEVWHNIGRANLDREGIDFYTLKEERSEIALPNYLQQEAGTFDLVFIDGWHTFDHTLVDLFFAMRLIRVGGHVVVDDCNWAAVAKAVDYVSSYPNMTIVDQSKKEPSTRRDSLLRRSLRPSMARRILAKPTFDRCFVQNRHARMVALEKLAEDARRWDWFEEF